MDPLDDALTWVDPDFAALALAVGIGLLFGVERGWQARTLSSGQRTAGVRTFTLAGLTGGVFGLLARDTGEAVLVAGVLVLGGLVLAGYLALQRKDERLGLTTATAQLLAFALGALATRGQPALAAAAAVTAVAFLDVKGKLQRWLQRLERAELAGAIKLLLVSVVLLPILPDRNLGPGGVWNPYVLGWLVVLIAGVSFFGYFLLKLFGAHAGALLMGLAGGLASSTALTVAAARLARTTPALAMPLAASVGVATAVMCIRVVVIAASLAAVLFRPLALPLGVAAGGAALMALILARRGRALGGPNGSELRLGAPGDIGTALQLAALIAGISVLVHYARLWLETTGLYLTAALAGLADVDAITVSSARLAAKADGASPEAAATAILIACAVNTLVKLGIGVAVGGWAFARPLAQVVGATLLAGALAYLAAV